MKDTRATRFASLAVLVAPLALLPSATPDARAEVAAATASALPEDTRLAFTDERDHIHRVSVARDGTSFTADNEPRPTLTDVTGFSAEPIHHGEPSSTIGGSTQPFVSTDDSPEGEVYFREDDGSIIQVTCDPALETHPVAHRATGRFAYASDADGDWDIYVSSRTDTPPPEPAASTGCDPERTTVNVTGPGPDGFDDLWPTWAGDDLAFSRAPTSTFDEETGELLEPGGLADLYHVAQDEDGTWLDPEQLTNSPGIAETQPAAITFEVDTTESTWLAFTTTADRSDGSIRLLPVADPSAERTPWPSSIPQGREPVWSQSLASWSDPEDTVLAFTSTESDPYGDIHAAALAELADPEFADPDFVVGRPGVAESHPAWTRDWFEEASVDAVLVFTSRVRPGNPAGTDQRVLDADISDALAADGGERGVIVNEVSDPDGVRFDEAGPDYSPDGEQVAYSTNDGTTAGNGRGREIRIAKSDGSGPEPLTDLTDHAPGDIDRDPVWSPDGTRIAFVRERLVEDDEVSFYRPPKVWVADLEAGTVSQVTPDSYNIGTSGFRPSDVHPDWSPDGSRLVVQREPGLVTVDRPPPGWAVPTGGGLAARAESRAMPESSLWVIPADPVDEDDIGEPLRWQECSSGGSGGSGGTGGSGGCTGLVAVVGRTPAWSPDGSQIVYANRGQLDVLTFSDDACCAITLRPLALTGFDNSGKPTDARSVLSSADDPAWAPDGSEIAFAGQPTGQPDQRGIWAMRLRDDTGAALEEPELRIVTDGRGPETEPTYRPTPEPTADVAVNVTITGTPAESGGSVVARFAVTNHGPDPAEGVTLTTGFPGDATTTAIAPSAACNADGSGCGFGTLEPDELRVYRVRIEHPAPTTGEAVGTVSATTDDEDPSNNTDRAAYVFETLPEDPELGELSVTIELDEPIGYVGGFRTATVTVENPGPITAEDVTLSVEWPDLVTPSVPEGTTTPACLPAGDDCELGDLDPGDEIAFEVSLEGNELPEDETEATDTIVATATSPTGGAP